MLRERGMQAVTSLVAIRKWGEHKPGVSERYTCSMPLQKTPNKAAPELRDSLTQGKTPSSQVLGFYLESTGLSYE